MMGGGRGSGGGRLIAEGPPEEIVKAALLGIESEKRTTNETDVVCAICEPSR